jgi:hypothetical protein
MPRTAASPHARGRILAVAGAAAALAGAGTAAAAGTAQAATVPAPGVTGHTTAVVSTHATRAPLAAGQHSAAVSLAASTTKPGAAKPRAATDSTRPAAAKVSQKPAVKTAAKAGQQPVVKTAAKVSHGQHLTARAARVPARPYQMYDSVTPSAIPGGKAVATYADGPYAASPAQLHGKNVTWIDTDGTDPKGATVLDVEPGDATPAGAAAWASHRLDAHPHGTAVIYTMRSEWAAAQASIASLPHWQQHHVRWWIADPTGTPHLVPGSNATQWYWGTHYDISTVNPNF